MFSRTALLAVLSSLLVTFNSPANAQWNQEALDFSAAAFSEFPGPVNLSPIQTGTLATVWGGGSRSFKFSEDLTDLRHDVKIPEFFENELTVYLSVNPVTKRPKRGKTPLVVFIPGIFGDSRNVMAQAMIGWFSKMGYHVLTVPNSWSRAYNQSKPRHLLDYPNAEADAILAVTDWAISEIASQQGRRNIGHVHIIGESLGAFTAAVTYAKDSKSANPRYSGGATLLWPPISVTSGISALDSMIASTSPVFESKCRTQFAKLKAKLRVLRGKILREPTIDEIECAASGVAQVAFKMELERLTKSVAEMNGLATPDSSELNFNRFITGYSKRYSVALDSSNVFNHLDFWIARTER
ncbi:MAG: hypothetical protein V4692_05300, partial [Bdellovibrionota bacterium]